MKTFVLFLALALVFLPACASPYLPAAQALTRDYQEGKISANEYHTRMNELRALDMQWRQGVAQSFQNWANMEQQRQNQLYQQQLYQQQLNYLLYLQRRPQSGSGTIMGPSGTYYYNWQSY